MIDIMLPFWGEPRYLYETVEAVRGQTSDDWRLTVVDDCYPDPSVAEYFARLDDPKVTYIRHETNQGITENYAFCLSAASAELVMLLGCDDIPDPDFVSRVHEIHRHYPQADVIQPGVRVIDADGRVVRPLVDTIKVLSRPRAASPRLLAGEALAASLLRADWLYWPSLVFKRETIVQHPFRPGFPIIQDLALIIDIVAAGGSLLLDPHVCFSYRRHEASASTTALLDGRRFDGEQKYFALALSIMRRNGWRSAARAARLHSSSRAHALTLLPTALKARNTEAVRMLTAHALRP